MILTHHVVRIIVPFRILIGFGHSDHKIISQGAGTSGDQLQDLIGCQEGFHGVVGCGWEYCSRSGVRRLVQCQRLTLLSLPSLFPHPVPHDQCHGTHTPRPHCGHPQHECRRQANQSGMPCWSPKVLQLWVQWWLRAWVVSCGWENHTIIGGGCVVVRR